MRLFTALSSAQSIGDVWKQFTISCREALAHALLGLKATRTMEVEMSAESEPPLFTADKIVSEKHHDPSAELDSRTV